MPDLGAADDLLNVLSIFTQRPGQRQNREDYEGRDPCGCAAD
jgi:hypothetical protein